MKRPSGATGRVLSVANRDNDDGWGPLPPLHRDARRSNVGSLKVHLAAGADVHSRDHGGNTPLHHAQLPGVVRLLIEAGADINARNDEGETPLFYKQIPVLKELIAAGADVNAKDEDGNTPLHFYAFNNRPDICELLYEAGAKEVANSAGLTPTNIAHQLVIERIGMLSAAGFAGGLGIDPVTGKKLPPALHYLILTGCGVRAIEGMLSHGADVNEREPETGFLPLGCARTPEMVEFLIRAGADVNARDNSGRAALHYVAKDIAIIKALLTGGADVNVRDDNGATPLHYAAQLERVGDNLPLVDALLAAGADANARDNTLSTPIHYTRRAAVIERLIAGGADVNARDRNGRSLLHWGAMQKDIEPGAMDRLLEAGADVEAQDADGLTPDDLCSAR